MRRRSGLPANCSLPCWRPRYRWIVRDSVGFSRVNLLLSRCFRVRSLLLTSLMTHSRGCCLLSFPSGRLRHSDIAILPTWLKALPYVATITIIEICHETLKNFELVVNNSKFLNISCLADQSLMCSSEIDLTNKKYRTQTLCQIERCPIPILEVLM